jgi:hypothetical protein
MAFGYGPGGANWTPLIGCWTGPSSGPPDLLRAPGASPALASAGSTGLTSAALAPIAQQAIARWAAAGTSSDALAQTADTQVLVGSVPGNQLAPQSPAEIVIDRAATGDGGFADPAPGGGQGLAAGLGDSSLPALDPRAVDEVDLPAIVEQELGHLVTA